MALLAILRQRLLIFEKEERGIEPGLGMNNSPVGCQNRADRAPVEGARGDSPRADVPNALCSRKPRFLSCYAADDAL